MSNPPSSASSAFALPSFSTFAAAVCSFVSVPPRVNRKFTTATKKLFKLGLGTHFADSGSQSADSHPASPLMRSDQNNSMQIEGNGTAPIITGQDMNTSDAHASAVAPSGKRKLNEAQQIEEVACGSRDAESSQDSFLTRFATLIMQTRGVQAVGRFLSRLNEDSTLCWPPMLVQPSSSSSQSTRTSDLYSGAVYVVHSYLSFPELLVFSRTSRYYRSVAIGMVNPSGLRRMGHEIPFIAWDAATAAVRNPSQVGLNPDPDINEPDDSFLLRMMPAFTKLVQSSPSFFTVKQRTHATGTVIQTATASKAEVVDKAQSFLAMTSAPDYGITSNMRHVTYTSLCDSFDRLLVSPIIGRHLQELTINREISVADITLLSLRFPNLKSLHIECLTFGDENFRFLQNWGIKGLRLPPQLRSLRIYKDISPATQDDFQFLLQMLPVQCPLLQVVELQYYSSYESLDRCDLSPLLALPHLTRLDMKIPRDEGPRQSAVIQQLSQLKYLSLLPPSQSNVESYLSTAHTQLRTLPLRHFNEALLQAIADRTPQLYSVQIEESVYDYWDMVDLNVLLKFHSLRYLRYAHSVRFLDGLLCDRGRRCIAAHGSLDSFMSHVVSVLSQLRSLTFLMLGDMHIPMTARSINNKYFQSLNLSPQQPSQAQPQEELSAASSSLRSFLPVPGHCASLSIHPVLQIVSHLPLLIELSLQCSSARHLPSLAFLAHLPSLQSLEIMTADCLPIESLDDLRHVSSTLTALTLIHCFPVDSHGRSVYLMHDVLQPLQLSHPVTEAVTIRFPDSMKKNPTTIASSSETTSEGSSDVAVYAFNVPVPVPDVMSASSSSSSPSSSTVGHRHIPTMISPRHSSWYEIRRFTPPSVLRLLERQAMDRALSSDFIFDSFTAIPCQPRTQQQKQQQQTTVDRQSRSAPPLLHSRLLPQLQKCEIIHTEPNQHLLRFTYNRFEHPQHQFNLLKDTKNSGDETLHTQQQQMHEGYGLSMPDDHRFQFVPGFQFDRVLRLNPPIDPHP